ncbi:tRNA lysidine(34) synthetase TilS [Mollicutes bacterium LVI A0039]|nr:tRNA lysidine(34) synthetase TilS [Mollicutes bacterium LVI A0039]
MSKYTVAVSGGVDSMYLAHRLATNDQVAALVHINHHTRGAANDYEQQLVIDLGSAYNIPVYIFDYHHQDGNFQAKAREFRYARLVEVASKYTKKIATAHHLDDQLENCLLASHLVKSNLIEYRSKLANCYVYRPLLGIDKKMIYAQAKRLNLAYNEDLSNESLSYQRNINRYHLQDSDKLQRAQVQYIIEATKQQLVANCRLDLELDRAMLQAKSSTYRYLKIYQFIKANIAEAYIKNRQLESINQLIDLKKNSKYSVTNCKELFIGYDKIYMLDNADIQTFEAPLKKGLNEFNGIEFETTNSHGKIRTWKAGDRVSINNGHKKVSRLFIDHKIASHKRKQWPIVVDKSGEIIEIPKIWRKNEINK